MLFKIVSSGNFICPSHQNLLLWCRYFLAIFFSLLMLILTILIGWLVDLRLADVKHTLTNWKIYYRVELDIFLSR